MTDASDTDAAGAGRRAGFVNVPHYVADLNLRIGDGAGVVEAYFNFGVVTGSLSDYVTIQYPWRGVAGEHAGATGLVIAVRRDRSIRLGVFDTLTDALVALANTSPLPDYSPAPEAGPHEVALEFFEHCVAAGVACPRYQAEATRRERENIREALGREREALASGQSKMRGGRPAVSSAHTHDHTEA